METVGRAPVVYLLSSTTAHSPLSGISITAQASLNKPHCAALEQNPVYISENRRSNDSDLVTFERSRICPGVT